MDMVYEAKKEARIERERGDYLFKMLRSAEIQIDILKGENESLKRKIDSQERLEKKAIKTPDDGKK